MGWTQTRRQRRQVIGAAERAAVLGQASALCSPWPAAMLARPGRMEDGLRVRLNVAALAPDGPELAALRRGVAVTQQRSAGDPSDPRGWRFQANLHGAPDDEPHDNPAWRQCQHGSFFFLPWHRMYLYWFERILRRAAGDENLTLPYWDYALPGHRVLPAPFREPADAANALYLEDRDPAINAGIPPRLLAPGPTPPGPWATVDRVALSVGQRWAR